MASRRLFLTLLLLGLAGPGITPAFAGDDDGGGDGGGGGRGGGGGDGDGGNSGSGGGDDDGGKDDGGKDDDDRDDDRGDDKKEDRQGDDDEDDKIRKAVKSGKAESLGSILPEIRRRYPGKVVRIRLTGAGSRMMYRIRVISRENRLIEVRVNALSGKILGASNI